MIWLWCSDRIVWGLESAGASWRMFCSGPRAIAAASSALSISPLECVRWNERLDSSPDMPHSLSLVAVLWFRFISPFTRWGSLPWLPQPGQCPLPRPSYFPLLHCVIAVSCESFSLWSSNPTDGGKLSLMRSFPRGLSRCRARSRLHEWTKEWMNATRIDVKRLER